MVLILALSGCSGGIQDALGMGKRSPDEFAVVSRAPLIVPPDFGLRPPRPGESRPGVDTPSETARASLVGRTPTTSTDGTATGALADTEVAGDEQDVGLVAAGFGGEVPVVVSRGEEALVAEATTTPADPNIRRKIALENQQLAQVEQELFTRLIKWRDPATLGRTIDPNAETQRLRSNRVQGKPVTEGEQVMIVQRRTSALQGVLKEVF